MRLLIDLTSTQDAVNDIFYKLVICYLFASTYNPYAILHLFVMADETFQKCNVYYR